MSASVPARHAYPAASRDDITDIIHNRPINDPYRWLEDAQSPATVAWSVAQDDLFSAQRADWPLREHFERRVSELSATGSVGVPIWRGERCWRMRRSPQQEHAVLTLSEPGPDGALAERVLLDPMAIDPTGLTTLDAWQPSKEGHLLAYQLSSGGTEESVLRVLDLRTGDLVDGPIDRTRYSPVAWLPGGEAFYYVRRLAADQVPEGEQQFHRRIYLHRVGTPTDQDVEIFGSGHDHRSYYGVSVSRDGTWLIVSRSTGTEPRNDLWIAELSAQNLTHPDLRVIQTGVDAQTSAFVGRDGRLYISTDLNAPRGRFAVTDPHNPGPETWHTLLGESGTHDGHEAVLEDVALCEIPGADQGSHDLRLVASWRRHAVSELSLHTDDGTRIAEVATPGLGSVGALVERYEGGAQIWFAYTDHTTPTHIYALDAGTGEVRLEAAPPGLVSSANLRSEQVAYTSADGTTVHMFVLRSLDHPTTGANADPQGVPVPTILYGYGGFGVSMTPGYSASIQAWLEAGGAYAIANLRGGNEEGEQWHRDGMLAAKHHVYEDFEAAAEWLIANGVTTSGQLCISGGSNGGLLVGAALTRRPQLYAAVLCSAPLLDMVRYERFGLGSTWNVEYGSAEVAEEFEWLISYSPYHHVHEGTAYPATLFTIFDGDTRVDPLHARKLCAALQHATSSDRPILLRREKDVGHSSRSLSRSIALAGDTLAFAAHHTALSPTAISERTRDA